MIETVDELFSLKPENFRDSYDLLKDNPEALKELQSIRECLNEKYQEASVKYEMIQNSGKPESEKELDLLELEKDIKEAECKIAEDNRQLIISIILEEQEKIEELKEKKRQLQAGLDFINGKGMQMGVGYHREEKIFPNDPCPCGSGKKYKKCCGRN